MTVPTPREQLATIGRAVAHLRSTDRELLLAQLASTRIGARWKRDPAALADELARITPRTDASLLAGTWTCAQQVLQAAGLPTD